MSIHKIKSGETLIVEGPARINVEDGELTSIGAPIRQGDYLVVKKSRQVAIEGVTDSRLAISLGVGAHIELMNTTTIPLQWTELAEKLKSHNLPFKAVFFGDVDTGKTTFAVYLGNLFCQWGINSVILSTDVGQGYPGLISLYHINYPIIDITEVNPTDAYFVGAVSPNCFEHRVITGTQKMLKAAQQLKTQALFVDTTGWVYGYKARELKTSLLRLIQPDILIIVERERELEHLVKPFSNLIDEIYRMPISQKIRYRDRIDRKFLRESMLSRQLTKEAKTIEFHFNDIGFIHSFLNTGKKVSDAIGEKIGEIVGYVPEYIELCSDVLLIVENIEQPLSDSVIDKLQEEFSYLIIRVFDSKTIENVLIGLLDSQNNFLGFGVVTHIDFVKQIITILSSVTKDKIASIQFGSLKVTQSGQEICWIRPYSF